MHHEVVRVADTNGKQQKILEQTLDDHRPVQRSRRAQQRYRRHQQAKHQQCRVASKPLRHRCCTKPSGRRLSSGNIQWLCWAAASPGCSMRRSIASTRRARLARRSIALRFAFRTRRANSLSSAVHGRCRRRASRSAPPKQVSRCPPAEQAPAAADRSRCERTGKQACRSRPTRPPRPRAVLERYCRRA